MLLTKATQRFDHGNTTNMHDEEVKNGTAENYALSLSHLVVTFFPEACQKRETGQLSLTLAHEIAFLCNCLDKMLRCSDATLATFGSKFIKQELADIADTSCESTEQIKAEIMVLVEYFQRFMDVLEDPDSKIHPDLDFGSTGCIS